MNQPPPQTQPNSPTKGLLDELLVIRIATVIMGPLAGRLFAKLGADVVHIEAPDGDVIRRSGRYRNPGMSGAALSLGGGKMDITLDFSEATDRTILNNLVEVADVVIMNYLPRQRRKFGFDWQVVAAANPQCILITAQGFSSLSSKGNTPAYDDIIQAASGLSDIYHRPLGWPQYAPCVFADKVCTLTMVYSGLSAIHRRHVIGLGQWVDVPMFDAMTDFNLVEQLNDYTFSPPLGGAGWDRTIDPARRPHPTTYGWVCVLPYSDRHWRDFLAIDDPFIPYPTNRDRNAHVEEAQALIAMFITQRSTAKVVETCRKHGIPIQAVNKIEDFVYDEYLRKRETVEPVEHPSEGRYWRSTPNVDFSESPMQPVKLTSEIDGNRDQIMAIFEHRKLN